MNNNTQKLRTKLLLIFWGNIILLISISLFLVKHIGLNGKSETADDFIVERFGIIIPLLFIPLSLKYYHKRYKKISKEKDGMFLSKFRNIYLFRLLGIDLAIIFNLIGFYYIGAVNFMYLVVIGLLAFLLCGPNKDEMNATTETNVNRDIDVTDENTDKDKFEL